MKLGTDHHLPTHPKCLACGKLLDGATGINDDAHPDPDDWTVCIYCGHIMVFTRDLMLRNPTATEIRQIAGDSRIVAIQRARKAMEKEDD